MHATHPTVLEMLVPVRRDSVRGELTVPHPLDYVARRRFPVEARTRRVRS
jgi:hypothetical protein